MPAAAQASASAVRQLSSRSARRRHASRPARSRSAGIIIGGPTTARARENSRGTAKRSQLFDPPRPVVAEAHRHERQLQPRREIDRPLGQLAARAARAVGRDRQMLRAAAFVEFPNRPRAAAIGRAADAIEAEVMGDAGQDVGVAVLAQAASPGGSGRGARAAAGCTRARRRRSAGRRCRARGRPSGRRTRPACRASASRRAMPLAASSPPSFMKKPRVRGKCFFFLRRGMGARPCDRACRSLTRASRTRPSLFGPLAAEDFDGGAGHVDVVVLFVPFDRQVAAEQVDRDVAIACGRSARRPRTRHRRPCRRQTFRPSRAPTCAAAVRRGRAPSTNSQFTRFGNCGSTSSCGPTPSTQSSVGSSTNVTQCGLPIETAVTRNSRPPTAIGTSTTGSSGPRGERRVRRNLARGQDRLAHVDADRGRRCHAATFSSSVQTRPADSIRSGLRRADAVVVDVLGDAADAVAAHFGVGAVGVEHPHLGVGPLGGADQDQAVAADAEAAVGDAAGQLRRVGRASARRSNRHRCSRCRRRASW